MLKYIPDGLYLDKENKEKVLAILDFIPETSLRIPGVKTLEDVIDEIEQLGEYKIAEYLRN